jgi:hypothetical protein
MSALRRVFSQRKLSCRTPHGEERQIVCLFETFAEAVQIAEASGDKRFRISTAMASRETLNTAEAVFVASSISSLREPVGIQE